MLPDCPSKLCPPPRSPDFFAYILVAISFLGTMRRDHDSHADGLLVCPQSREKFLHGFRFWIWDESFHTSNSHRCVDLTSQHAAKSLCGCRAFLCLEVCGHDRAQQQVPTTSAPNAHALASP